MLVCLLSHPQNICCMTVTLKVFYFSKFGVSEILKLFGVIEKNILLKYDKR